MRNLVRLVLRASGAACLGGCLSSFDAYPVAGNPVNPRPAGDYRVMCESSPSPLYLIAQDFFTSCRQELAPDGTAIRARG